MYKLPDKIKSTYNLCDDQYKKTRKWAIIGILSLAVSSAGLFFFFYYSVDEPLWSQPGHVQLSFILIVSGMLIGIIIMPKIKTAPFGKKVFVTLFEAYTSFERFNNLRGTSSQSQADLKNVKDLLSRVSKTLIRKETMSPSDELKKQVDNKYAKLGKLIQTKILYLIENGEKTGLVQQKLLVLLETFSDATIEKIDSCIKSINEISETGPFEDKKIFLEKYPRIRSWGNHVGKFIVSLVTVSFVAYAISIVFSTPITELTATTIVVATFALFAAWEFKSR